MIKVFLTGKIAIASLVIVFALSACALQTDKAESALLAAESESARAEIVAIINQSFGGKNIPIAKDVFQHSSRLLLGSTVVTSPKGVKIIPAHNNIAIVFELFKQGDRCLLRRIDNSQEWQLQTKECFKR